MESAFLGVCGNCSGIYRNLLVPIGITYDLFECLAGQMDLHGLSTVPLFFVSPVADSSLAYSNIMAEWLSAAKQSRFV